MAELTTSQAAAEIIALINGRPDSPSAAEIEAVLAKAMPILPGAAADTTITGAAKSLEETHGLISIMDAADQRQSNGPVHGNVPVDFDRHERAAHQRRNVLEQTILGLEASSIDELLSLLLVTADAVETFASDHSDHDTNVDTLQEWEAIERAMHAMTRCLVHVAGADSPILRYYAIPSTLPPLPQQMAIALERAKELSDQDAPMEAANG